MSAMPVRSEQRSSGPPPLQRSASGIAAVMAVLYLLIFAGVLSVGRAEAGELGVLGVASVVFAAIAVALWFLRSRLLWIAVALLQLMMASMYVGVASERDPAYEVWGLSLRLLSAALVALLVALLVRSARRRRGAR